MAEQVGVLYSSVNGIILRVINPDNNSHLNWLDDNKPVGTTLLRINKSAVGADSTHIPNVDYFISYAQNNLGITLRAGEPCAVVDKNGIVVDNVIACPTLYKQKLNRDAVDEGREKHLLVEGKMSDVGDQYDSKKRKFFSQTEIAVLPLKDKPKFDKKDLE